MNQSKDKIFRRTESGEAEIRDPGQSLSNAERMILLFIVGEKKYADLKREFEKDESTEFELNFSALLDKGLVVERLDSSSFNNSDLMTSQIEKFGSEEFFSSSMDPLNSGSGLVVDTRSNSMRSVNLKKKKPESVYDVDIPLSLELDANLRLKKSKRSNKLVQVFPDPAVPKKRRRSKRPKAPPVSKWQMWVFGGLTVFGILMILIALLIKL
ncbi:hypothetical protein [Undibacterium sp.]|uniref:hypothetical protein n=1 Tax=Undibacterium sp. TaxID=1914977 RepID=UPI003753A356